MNIYTVLKGYGLDRYQDGLGSLSNLKMARHLKYYKNNLFTIFFVPKGDIL